MRDVRTSVPSPSPRVGQPGGPQPSPPATPGGPNLSPEGDGLRPLVLMWTPGQRWPRWWSLVLTHSRGSHGCMAGGWQQGLTRCREGWSCTTTPSPTSPLPCLSSTIKSCASSWQFSLALSARFPLPTLGGQPILFCWAQVQGPRGTKAAQGSIPRSRHPQKNQPASVTHSAAVPWRQWNQLRVYCAVPWLWPRESPHISEPQSPCL